MPVDPNPLQYRSDSEARSDDVRAVRRSLRTWLILWLVWAVGLVVWVGYIIVIGAVVIKVFA